MFADIHIFNSYWFITRGRPWRTSRDPMDLLLPPVRVGGRVAFELVACRRLVRNDPFAIFAIFVLGVGGAVATPAVATTASSAAVALSIAPSPCGEGGE